MNRVAYLLGYMQKSAADTPSDVIQRQLAPHRDARIQRDLSRLTPEQIDQQMSAVAEPPALPDEPVIPPYPGGIQASEAYRPLAPSGAPDPSAGKVRDLGKQVAPWIAGPIAANQVGKRFTPAAVTQGMNNLGLLPNAGTKLLPLAFGVGGAATVAGDLAGGDTNAAKRDAYITGTLTAPSAVKPLVKALSKVPGLTAAESPYLHKQLLPSLGPKASSIIRGGIAPAVVMETARELAQLQNELSGKLGEKWTPVRGPSQGDAVDEIIQTHDAEGNPLVRQTNQGLQSKPYLSSYERLKAERQKAFNNSTIPEQDMQSPAIQDWLRGFSKEQLEAAVAQVQKHMIGGGDLSPSDARTYRVFQRRLDELNNPAQSQPHPFL